MSALRVLIIDDEPLAREGLGLRLRRFRRVEVVAECGSIEAAIEVLAVHRVDVAFVDIQMPGGDGFLFVERIGRSLLPAIIFVTAHEEHALRAFRVGAIDYLLKPFDDEALRTSVERVRTFVRLVRNDARVGVPDLAADDGSMPPLGVAGSSPAPILVRHNGRVVMLYDKDIEWIEAIGDRVRIHARQQAFMLRSTMRAIAARLDPARFARVHRSVIVAISLIRELQPYSRGEHVVVLADGTKVPLSRRYRSQLLAAMGGTVI